MALSNDEILSLIRSEESNAIGLGDENSDISKQRAQALNYYKGDMPDLSPVENGMSRVVSRDVFEVVEGALPELIDIFTSTDNVMEFKPNGEDDVDAARQETDVVNHVFYEENDGFMILYSFIKDGLLSKTGYTKVMYRERTTDEEEHYFGIDDDTLATLEADDEVEITEKETTTEIEVLEVADIATGLTSEVEVEVKTHDVVLIRKKDMSGVEIEVLAPEDVSVSRRSTNIQKSNYVRHEPKNITRGDLIELGVDRELVMSLPRAANRQQDESIEKDARDTIQEDDSPRGNENKVNEFVDVADNYIRMDYDGDGKPELWHVMTGGPSDNELLMKQRVERIPISSWGPIPITHEFFALSLADEALDIQRIKTFFERSSIDSTAFQNNQRPIINSAMETDTTIDDVMQNRPGQPVRVNGDARAALSLMQNNNITPDNLALVNYYTDVRQKRTGVNDIAQGIDPDSLNSAAGTATGFQGLMSKSMLKLKLIAKICAHTGLKDMFINIHWALQKNQDKEKAFNLRGEWVNVNPREWKMRTNMRINVGLGTGTKTEQIAMLNNTLQNQIFAMQQGTDQTDMSKINYTLRRIAELGGLGDPDQFYNRVPRDTPPPEQQPDPATIKAQMDAQLQEQELLLKAQDQEFQQAFQVEKLRVEAQLKAAELDQKGLQFSIEANLKDKQLNSEVFLKNKELEQEAEIEGTKFGVDVANNIGANVRFGGDQI